MEGDEVWLLKVAEMSLSFFLREGRWLLKFDVELNVFFSGRFFRHSLMEYLK